MLERLLKRSVNAGTVVAVSNTDVVVATARGAVNASRTGDATDYQVGDRVRLNEGQIVGRLRSAGTRVRV